MFQKRIVSTALGKIRQKVKAIPKKNLVFAAMAILIIGAAIYIWPNYGWKTKVIGKDFSCLTVEENTIKGQSMEPLLPADTKVKGLQGYYDCNKIEREEAVIIEFKTREETFVKRMTGLPGDKMEFVKNGSEYHLKLNDEILKNSAGETYLFSEKSQRFLSIPLKEGKIPDSRYLVLSDETTSQAYDSRWYGFLEKEHLKGRVIK